MCDVINSLNLNELTTKFDDIIRSETLRDTNNELFNFKDLFIDKLDSISSAELSGFNIKIFPPIINCLFNIKHLDISSNHLRSFPDHRKSWRRIISINLSRNKLSTVPQSLLQLKTLRYVSMANNNLRSIPPNWSLLSNLEELDLSLNKIGDISPLMCINSLKILKVNHNFISVIPKDVHNLENLITFNCQNNQICELPKSLTKLENLENFDVSENPLIFPPYNIVSRGLTHILAYLARNDPEVIQPPPPLPRRTLRIQHQDLQEQRNCLSNKEDVLRSNQDAEDGNINDIDLNKDDHNETGVVLEEDYAYHEFEQVTKSDHYRKSISISRTSFPFSLTESRPSSAMAAIYSQFSNVSSNPEWSEFDFSNGPRFRRLHSQPELYEHVVMVTDISNDTTLSLTSLSDDENDIHVNDNLELSQSHHSWNFRNSNHKNSLQPVYRNNMHMPKSKIMEHRRLALKNDDRPMPPPRNNFSPPLNTGRSKLYVRRITPSPPPRHSRLFLQGDGSISSEENRRTPSPPPPLPVRQVLPPAPRRSVDDRRTDGNCPSLRYQRSFSPSTLRLEEDLLQERSKVWQVEDTKLPTRQRQTTRATTGYLTDDSEDEISSDSSCEDLPVPLLRSHTTSPSLAFPNSSFGGVSAYLNRQPGQPVPPPTTTICNQQQHRYLKNGQGHVLAHAKANPSLQHLTHRTMHNGDSPYRKEHYNDNNIILSSSYPSSPSSCGKRPSPQVIYPQTKNQQYDELWSTTAENLRLLLIWQLNIPLPANPNALALELRSGIYIASFINNFLGFRAVKRINEVSGSSWQSYARQNLLSCREIVRKIGVPKHRLFSVTRVLQADSTVGLFGLYHCLQTFIDVWASRPSTFMPGGLGVREKLTNQPVAKKSLLGDITTTRQMRHQHQLQSHHRHRSRTYSYPNFHPGLASGVFSDV